MVAGWLILPLTTNIVEVIFDDIIMVAAMKESTTLSGKAKTVLNDMKLDPQSVDQIAANAKTTPDRDTISGSLSLFKAWHLKIQLRSAFVDTEADIYYIIRV